MKTRRIFATQGPAALVTLSLRTSFTLAQEQQRPHPEAICTAENTCGSASTPCIVEIKRTASEASATPGIPKAKGNVPFCVKAGTTMTWKGVSKNTGFVLDFGPHSPFDSDTIIGGSERSPSTVAKKKGCYKYSVGACVSGAIDGMCGSAETELIVTGSE